MTEPTYSLSPEEMRVVQFLQAHNITDRVKIVKEEILTAEYTAKVLGIQVNEIAKSVLITADNNPVLVILPGNKRVRFKLIKRLLGVTEIKLAEPAIVKTVTGFDVRGVSPIGHIHPVLTLIDRELSGKTILYAAAGSHHAVFRTSYEELLILTKAITID